MTSDLQSLLAAIVADPADDTARLVYADCLQEHGNSARAEFIRLQVEAERHHPDSNARGALEAQARVLFEQNWMEWWGEVCEAIGLEATAGRYGLSPDGTIIRGAVDEVLYDPFGELIASQDGLALPEVAFRRGFPEAVVVTPYTPAMPRANAHLARWREVAPLVELTARAWPEGEWAGWFDGAFQRSVSALGVEFFPSDALGPLFLSSDLVNVERLFVRNAYQAPSADTAEARQVLAAPYAPRLKHVALPLWDEPSAVALAASGALPLLESFDATLNVGSSANAAIVTALTKGSALARLRHLSVRNWSSRAELDAVCRAPVWSGLRSLHLTHWGREAPPYALETADLPELNECRLAGVRLTAEAVRDLARSPLLKRVRHFALSGIYNDGRALLPLVDAVDPARIETFAVGVPYFPERAANALREKFGDKFRLLST